MSESPEEKSFTVEDEGIRLDRFLTQAHSEFTRSRLQRSIQDGHVHVNGDQATKAGLKLKAGWTVRLILPKPELSEAVAQDLPLEVLYEDKDIIVVNKAPGVVVHPAPGHPDGTLVNALLHHCEDLSGIGGVLRPGIVHRLDKETSGVLVVAKNDAAHQNLTEQLAERTMKRIYLAMVMGSRLEGKGNFETLYGRAPADRIRFSSKIRTGKWAKTHWQILARGTICSLARVQLETGRTHQIRVHFADHGHPVVGDPLYGKSLKGFDTSRNPHEARSIATMKRQALHASLLALNHPTTNERMQFVAPVSPDIRKAACGAFGEDIWELLVRDFGVKLDAEVDTLPSSV